MKLHEKARLVRGLICGLCIAGIVGALQAPLALAGPGQLDPTFGNGGRAVAALDFGEPRFWYAVKVQAVRTPNGRILVSGNETLVKYLANGRLDKGFARGGILHVESVEGYPFELNGLGVDSQGRIVTVGTAIVGASEPGAFSPKAAILRFEPDGTPDPSFGGGDGAVLTNLGSPPPSQSGVIGGLQISGVAIDAADRIVVSGSRIDGTNYCGPIWGGFVARLMAQGDPDPTFGNGGIAIYDPALLQSADELALDRAGAPIFFGAGYECRGSRQSGPTLYRDEPNGQPNLAFGWQGRMAVSYSPRQIAFDRRGRIVAIADGKLIRLLPSGAPDPTFWPTIVNLRGARSALDDLAVGRDGSVLVTGREALYDRAHRREPRRRLVLARLGPRGKLDRTFGKAGIVTSAFGHSSNTVGRQVLLDGKEHAIVVGSVRNRKLPTGEGLALFRYNLTP